jgi:6-phosphogluconate dehydrogenase
MKLGYIGLGKMGFNMVERLLEKGHRVMVYDMNREAVSAVAAKGAEQAGSIAEMAGRLEAPRLFWIMVPFSAVDAVLQELMPYLAKGDTIIDGGNSPYKHSMRRAGELLGRGIDFLDAGISGGPAGARSGSCIMVGGREEAFRRHEALFRDLAHEKGYVHTGPAGSGHFVKMVHNGIEYGMMQALAEGFTVLKTSPFGLDMAAVADLYQHGSVIESRLVEWLRQGYEQFGPDLKEVSGSAAQSGEAMWTIEAARELGVSVPVIQASLDFRLASARNPSYTAKVISVLRHQFGGHEMKKKS